VSSSLLGVSGDVRAARTVLMRLRMSGGVKRYMGLRAWQACNRYKRAIYRLCADGPISRDWSRRRQLEESVAGPPAHLAEGYGRFNPPDFARFVVFARSSLMESQNHIDDGVDKGYINQQMLISLSELAGAALKEVGGLLEYLQSPEALDNARRIRERRIASRTARRQRTHESQRASEPGRAEGPDVEGRPMDNENSER
jgi:four helix bundle protein